MVTISATPPNDRADVGVDRLDDSEGELVAAVAQDAFQVSLEHGGELLESRQPLPAQTPHPVLEETTGSSFVGVTPQALDLLLEEVGFEQPPVEGEDLVELAALGSVEVCPAS